jgi:hypothetical protein
MEHLSWEMRGVTPIPETNANIGIAGCLTSVKSKPCKGSSYHAMGVRGRLRFDRSLPIRDYVSLRRKGSQVKQ